MLGNYSFDSWLYFLAVNGEIILGIINSDPLAPLLLNLILDNIIIILKSYIYNFQSSVTPKQIPCKQSTLTYPHVIEEILLIFYDIFVITKKDISINILSPQEICDLQKGRWRNQKHTHPSHR